MRTYNLHDFRPIKRKTFALTNQRMILIWRDLRCECSRCFGDFIANARGLEVVIKEGLVVLWKCISHLGCCIVVVAYCCQCIAKLHAANGFLRLLFGMGYACFDVVVRFIFTNNEYHERTNERTNKANEMQLNAPTKVFNLQTVNTTTTANVIYDSESLIIIKWVGLGLVYPLLFRFPNDQMSSTNK